MKTFMTFISENSYWIFSGIGVAAIAGIVKIFFGKKEKVKSVAHTVTVINNIGETTQKEPRKGESGYYGNPKSQTRILFVDDKHKEFKIVAILKKNGWINTKSVDDITDLDDINVLEADIIFVDINGVGTVLFPQDQGLGLASALKKKYPSKKIVIYSAESKGDRFHKALKDVDACLYKDAEPYQFISLIEDFSKQK